MWWIIGEKVCICGILALDSNPEDLQLQPSEKLLAWSATVRSPSAMAPALTFYCNARNMIA